MPKVRAPSVKQTKLLDGLCEGLSLAQAMENAGYRESSKKAVVASPAVAEAVRMGREKIAERYALSKKDVIEGFMDAVTSAANSMELIAAWREIGKLIGAYEPHKIEVTHRQEQLTVEEVRQLPSSELARLANMGDVVDAEYFELGAEPEGDGREGAEPDVVADDAGSGNKEVRLLSGPEADSRGVLSGHGDDVPGVPGRRKVGKTARAAAGTTPAKVAKTLRGKKACA